MPAVLSTEIYSRIFHASVVVRPGRDDIPTRSTTTILIQDRISMRGPAISFRVAFLAVQRGMANVGGRLDTSTTAAVQQRGALGVSANIGSTGDSLESIQLISLAPTACIALLHKLLSEDKYLADSKLDILKCGSPDFVVKLSEDFDHLSKMRERINARDIEVLAKVLSARALEASDGGAPLLTEEMVLGELQTILNERLRRRRALAPILH
ncbi:hypothetical protein ZTR_10504 [Talaromyces verruculosus]|nr:hypothetical protein ZTR_10504 [Talaromyces verruculosus]